MTEKTPEALSMQGSDKPYKMGCKLAGQGRGDCEHFVGMPDVLNQNTTDEYGIPLGWCDFCWIEFRLRTERATADELRKELTLPHYLTEPYDKAVDELFALRLFAKKAVEALTSVLPINGYGQCSYCGFGSKPDENLMHYDTDNVWNGNKECFNHKYYEEAHAILTDPICIELMKEKV